MENPPLSPSWRRISVHSHVWGPLLGHLAGPHTHTPPEFHMGPGTGPLDGLDWTTGSTAHPIRMDWTCVPLMIMLGWSNWDDFFSIGGAHVDLQIPPAPCGPHKLERTGSPVSLSWGEEGPIYVWVSRIGSLRIKRQPLILFVWKEIFHYNLNDQITITFGWHE